MIEIKEINKFYKNRQVLFDFSTKIDLNKNSIWGVLGPNVPRYILKV